MNNDWLASELEALEASVPVASPPGRPAALRPRRRLALLAAAVVIGVILVAVVVAALPDRGQPVGEATSTPTPSGEASSSAEPTLTAAPSPSSSPSPTASPLPTLQPTDGPSPIAAPWHPLPVADTTGLYSEVSGVTSWNDTLLAFGRTDRTHGGIWLSPDGVTWTPADVPVSPPGTVVWVADIVPWGDGLLAFGTLAHPDGSGPMGGVLWASDDGRTWEVRNKDVPGALLGVSDQLILVHSMEDVPAAGDVHLSEDGGISWTAVERPDSWLIMAGMVADDIYFVGGSAISSSAYDGTAAIWTSGDGTVWHRSGDLGRGVVGALAPLPDGTLVALGARSASPDDLGPVWTSADGNEWEAASEVGACCAMQLAPTPDGVIAWGYIPSQSGPSTILLATSPDARTWTISQPIAGRLSGLVYTRRFGVVLAGNDSSGRPAVVIDWPLEW